MRSSLSVIITAALLWANGCYAQSADTTTVFIKLTLPDVAKARVTKAPLKYNKHLALSFTLDDGYRSAYLTAFPLLNGGDVAASTPDEWNHDEGGDGQPSKGLFYTDGNGTLIPFKIGLAINAGKIGNEPANRGHVSWPEVLEMYNAGWDLINHGYNHLTKDATFFPLDVIRNIDTVQKYAHMRMSQFAVPGGEHQDGYEHIYEKLAFDNGAYAISSYKGAAANQMVTEDLGLEDLIYERVFLQSNPDNTKPYNVIDPLHQLDSLMYQPEPIWNNSFTHGVGNSNLWGLSLRYPEFKFYMTTLYQKYGAAGTDQIWVASVQEVYEYLWLKEHTQITTKQKGRELTISISVPSLPKYFRYHTLTLQVPEAIVTDFSNGVSNITKKQQVKGSMSFGI